MEPWNCTSEKLPAFLVRPAIVGRHNSRHLLDWLSTRLETSTSPTGTLRVRRAAFFESTLPAAPSPQSSTICGNRLDLLFGRPTLSVFLNQAATGLDV